MVIERFGLVHIKNKHRNLNYMGKNEFLLFSVFFFVLEQ